MMAKFAIYVLIVMVTVLHDVSSEIIRARTARVDNHYTVILGEGTPESAIQQVLDGLKEALGNDIIKNHDLRIFTHVVTGFAMELEQMYEPYLEAELDKYVDNYYIETTIMLNGSTHDSISWGQDRIDQRNLPLDSTYTAAGSGEGVNIYVVDTGVQTSNKWFGGRVNLMYDYDSNRPRKKMCHPHGTNVAGVAASTQYGVANGAQVHSVRVLNCNNAGTSSAIIAGLEHIVANGEKPAVIIMAISGAFLQSMNDALEGAINAGYVAVTAAGNSASDACDWSPGFVDTALNAAATSSADHATAYSNYGSCVDIFAPGNYIRTPGLSNKDTFLISGTSMAAPFVAGIAAIHLQKNPNLTPAQVNADILSSATSGLVWGDGIDNGSPSTLAYIDPNFMNN